MLLCYPVFRLLVCFSVVTCIFSFPGSVEFFFQDDWLKGMKNISEDWHMPILRFCNRGEPRLYSIYLYIATCGLWSQMIGWREYVFSLFFSIVFPSQIKNTLLSVGTQIFFSSENRKSANFKLIPLSQIRKI